MDKEKFAKIIVYMCIAYDKEFTKEQLEVWYSFLKDYSADELNMAVKNLINTEKYIPTIAHIKEEIARIKTTNIASAEDEWQEVIKAVGKYGYYREQEALQSLKPYTSKIVRYIGFKRICSATSDEQVWNKKEFIGEYNALKDKVIIDLQIGTKENKMIEKK